MKKHKYKIGIDTRTLEHDIENLRKATEKFKKTVIDAKALSKVKKIMDKSIERTGEPHQGFVDCFMTDFLQLVKLDNTEQSKNNGFMGFIQFIISVKRFVEAMEELGEILEVEPEQAQKEQEFMPFTEFTEAFQRYCREHYFGLPTTNKFVKETRLSIQIEHLYEFFKTLPLVGN